MCAEEHSELRTCSVIPPRGRAVPMGLLNVPLPRGRGESLSNDFKRAAVVDARRLGGRQDVVHE
jgi:hypothetical protein